MTTEQSVNNELPANSETLLQEANFLNTILHEICTALSNVKLGVDNLEDRKEEIEILKAIKRNVLRLENLFKDLSKNLTTKEEFFSVKNLLI